MLNDGIFSNSWASQIAKANQLPSALNIAQSIANPLGGLDWSKWHGIAKPMGGLDWLAKDWGRIINPIGSSLSSAAKDWGKTMAGVSLMQSTVGSALNSIAAMSAVSIDTSAFRTLTGGVDTSSLTNIVSALSKLNIPENYLKNDFSALTAVSKAAASIQTSFERNSNFSALLANNAALSRSIVSGFQGVASITQQLREFNSLQQAVFGNWRSQLDVSPRMSSEWIVQNQRMQAVLRNLYGSLTYDAINAGKWTELSLGVELGEEIFSFGDELTSKLYVTKEALFSLLDWAEKMIMLIVVLPAKKAAPFAKTMLFLLAIASDLITDGVYLSDRIHPTEAVDMSKIATKEDCQKISKKLDSLQKIANLSLAKKEEARVIVRPTAVYLKPKANATVIGQVPTGTIVVVVQRFSQWVYISYQDTDNQPAHGWARKKYLAIAK